MSKKIITMLLVLACVICAVAILSSCGTKYTVTFDPNGGTLDGPTTIQVKEGGKIPVPTVTKDGSILTGWYAGAKANTKWDFENDVVTSDVTLKAWWTGGSQGPESSCDHDWQPNPKKEWIEVTCSKDGKEYYKCTKCLFTKTETIKATGHVEQIDIVEAGCATEGYTLKYCTVEGCTYPVQKYNIIQPTGNHIYDIDGDGFDDFVTVKEPTIYIPGKEEKTCKNCGAKNTFPVNPLGLEEDFKDLAIDNFVYTGGKYVNQPFVDVSASAGIGASSHHTICVATNMNDGSADTYWSANTLAEGSTYTGDQIFMNFSKEYDIGIISFVVPFYSSWGLGDNCYVSYDLEAEVNGQWVKIGEINDKNAIQNGDSALVTVTLAEPVTTKSLRATVTHSTRYAPAMVYEIRAYAYVEDITRTASDMLSEVIASVSGKRNAYTDGASVLTDGRDDTGWLSNWRDVGYANATLEFPGERYVAAIEFTLYQRVGREVAVQIWKVDSEHPEGYWKEIALCTTTNEPVGTSRDGYQVVTNSAGTKVCAFAVEVDDRTTAVRLEVKQCTEEWTFFIYDFVPYTVVEKASDLPAYSGCRHNAFRQMSDSDVVAATCDKAGYTILTCASCGFKTKSDAVHATGHRFSEFTVTTAATGSAKGTKTATCTNGCGTTRTRTYTTTYEEATITKFYKNAPAAWAMTYDDGNYISACKWSIEQFKKYNYKATMNMAICYSDSYVEEWKEMFSTGYFDLGSHSYNHAGIYNNKVNESSFLKDVDRAHFWFMARFHGQQILTFATPNGATSVGTSLYATYLMAAARNGGDPGHITDVEGLLTPVNWGNFNTYASKSGETEGAYVLLDKDGNTVWYKAVPVTETVTDPETGEETQVPTGKYTFEVTTKGGYEKASLDSYTEDGDAEYILVHYISATGNFSSVHDQYQYKFVKKSDLKKNYVYIEQFGKLIDQNGKQYDPNDPVPESGQPDTRVPIEFEKKTGTYKYDPANYLFTWESTGSYDFNAETREYTFKADGSGKYTLAHVTLGSFEKVIDEVLAKEDLIVECLHSVEAATYPLGGMIHSSYVSTVSKFEYLKKQGLWVCSFTNVVQYLKEAEHAVVETVSITDTSIEISLTDDLEDYMFNHALTIKVDIPDDWTNIVVTQNGQPIEMVTNAEYKDNMLVANCTIMDGYLYVDAVPDCGNVLITVAE